MKNKKILLALGFLMAAIFGTLLPQWIVGPVEGSANEAVYQFVNLGMNSQADREKVKHILDHIVGIEEYNIDPNADRVVITFDKETMKAEWIAKSLEASGYHPDHFSKTKKES